MELASQKLADDYQHWIDKLCGADAVFDDCGMSPLDVLDVHFTLLDYFLENGTVEIGSGDSGLKDASRLTSVFHRRIPGGSGAHGRSSVYETCAQLFYGLIQDRPFPACNLQTALLSAISCLAKRDLAPAGSHKELEVITRIIASNTIRERRAFRPYTKFHDGEIRFLARYLQDNTRPLDRQSYPIACKDLDRFVRKFGFCLNNPHGGFIDILRLDARPAFLGLGRAGKKVGSISFRGWTREVPKKNLQALCEYTGLTAGDGFDPAQLLHDGPSPASLTIEYCDVLHRIAGA